jgi:DNA-binding transcriptional LysR family regulator
MGNKAVGTGMANIPTDLLRTLIAVVDMRSFTRAAQSLGVTQPAVSAQVKRLQVLLGGELFDKSAPGVTLTAKGEVVANYARRLLSINDQILDLTAHRNAADRLRVGIPTDYFEAPILNALAEFGASQPGLQIQVCTDASEALLRDLRRGAFDLIVAASDLVQAAEARRSWLEQNAWAAASPAVFETDRPVPLAVLGESNLSRRLSVAALEQAGRRYEIVYVGGSFAGLVGAAAAGVGVACWAKRALRATGLEVFDSAPPWLPRVPDVRGGVYLRAGLDGAPFDALADMIAAAVGDAAPDGAPLDSRQSSHPSLARSRSAAPSRSCALPASPSART